MVTISLTEKKKKIFSHFSHRYTTVLNSAHNVWSVSNMIDDQTFSFNIEALHIPATSVISFCSVRTKKNLIIYLDLSI